MSGLSFSKSADRRARVRDATRLGVCTIAIVLASAMPMSAQGLGDLAGLGGTLGDTVGGLVDTVDGVASPASDSFSDSGGVGGTVADAGQGSVLEDVGNTVAEAGETFNGPNRDGNDDIGDSAGALLDSILPASGTATDGLLQTTGDLLNGGPTASCTGPGCAPTPPQPPQPPVPCNTPECRPPLCVGNACDPRQPSTPRTPVAGGGGGGCSLPGNSTAYNGLRVVSNDGVMLGTITDVIVTPGLEIERVAFLTDRSAEASRPYCVKIGNVPFDSQSGQVVVGVPRSSIVQAAMR